MPINKEAAMRVARQFEQDIGVIGEEYEVLALAELIEHAIDDAVADKLVECGVTLDKNGKPLTRDAAHTMANTLARNCQTLIDENDALRKAGQDLLDDMARRCETDGKNHPSKSVREYVMDDEGLPVFNCGNGVLYRFREALAPATKGNE